MLDSCLCFSLFVCIVQLFIYVSFLCFLFSLLLFYHLVMNKVAQWPNKRFRYTDLTLQFRKYTCEPKIIRIDEIIQKLQHYRHTPVFQSITMKHLRVTQLNIYSHWKSQGDNNCHRAFPVLNLSTSYMPVFPYIRREKGNKLQ